MLNIRTISKLKDMSDSKWSSSMLKFCNVHVLFQVFWLEPVQSSNLVLLSYVSIVYSIIGMNSTVHTKYDYCTYTVDPK